MPLKSLHRELSEEGRKLGFLTLGVIPIEIMERESKELSRYLNLSHHGSMEYLSRNREIRRDPHLLLEGAESLILLLDSYKPSESPKSSSPKIASYAWGEDYHKRIKRRLKALSESLLRYDPLSKQRLFTDSAPLFERALAQRAGLGFIGKNNFLISREFGLHTFIAVIITTIKMDYTLNNRPQETMCGSCSRCIEACPTGALVAPFMLDSRRCISYQTIESKELFDPADGGERGGMLFGCDLCLEACPWSKKGVPTTQEEYQPLIMANGKSIIEQPFSFWEELNEESFNLQFKESPLRRAGVEKIKNNLKMIR